MQSNVMAVCNECFPVGWTVTLWMAGDSRPEGETIRDSPAFLKFGLNLTDKAPTPFPLFVFTFGPHFILCTYIPTSLSSCLSGHQFDLD